MTYTQRCGTSHNLSAPLMNRYRLALFDLDGVVYIDQVAIPSAPMIVHQARRQGMKVGFITNNASRTSQAVAEKLTNLGVQATPEEVVTSAQAACAVLARMLAPGASVLVVGAPALAQEVTLVGLTPVSSADDHPQAVVQGFSPGMDWPLLTEAVLAINAGVPWVLTNDDVTIPVRRGLAPGNGSFAALISTATGASPEVIAGKPHQEQMQLALQRFAHAGLVEHNEPDVVVVGDRLDTDIAGAAAVGMHSLAVLTGVCTPIDLIEARGPHRPTYVADTVAGLGQALRAIAQLHPDEFGQLRHGGWQVSLEGKRLMVAGEGALADGVAACCALVWQAVDRGQQVEDVSDVQLLTPARS